MNVMRTINGLIGFVFMYSSISFELNSWLNFYTGNKCISTLIINQYTLHRSYYYILILINIYSVIDV